MRGIQNYWEIIIIFAKNVFMKKYLFLILIPLFILTSCGGNNPWSPEDDINGYLTKNPYGVEFENGTDDDLFIECGDLSNSIIIVKSGCVSDAYHCSKPGITIKYNGAGTYWREKTKFIELSKDKVTRVVIPCP